MPLRKWKCGICGDVVVEGQRFTVTKDGFVHLECLYEKIASKGVIPRDIVALMDLLEAVNYLIVRAKEAARLATRREVLDMINTIRIEAEKEAMQLTSLLEKLSEGEKREDAHG